MPPATRGQKRQHGDNHGIETFTQSNKRRKLTNPEPLHSLLKKNGIDTSYGWGIVSFYDEKGKLIYSDKLIKYEVDTTLKIARYKGKEFPFNYIEYEDYIISFDEFKINIKPKKDVENLLDFASPDIEDNKEKSTPKSDDDETETEAENDDDETETEAENDDDDDDESSLIQNQNPIQIQHPNFHHQHQNPIQYQQENYYQQQNQYQQQMFQQQFSIQTMIRTEITTNLIPWMKEYIDSELQKLKQ
jgi:hypothetical protein